MSRSRRAAVVAITGLYLANWPAMVAGAFLGYTIDRAHGARMEWDGLGGLIFGAFAGVAVAHVFWAVVTWRLLRARSHRSDAVLVVVLVPIFIVATVIVLVAGRIQGGPLIGWMILASTVYPAVVAWWTTDSWTTEPTGSLDPGTR